MFALPFIALSFGGLVLANPTKRSGADTDAYSLSVVLFASSPEINSIAELTLTAAVTNVGAEDVKVLKYANILDYALPTQSFVVMKDGAQAAFTGIQLSIDPNQLSEESFIVIPAGKTFTVKHSISSQYDFASVGSGTFSFDPIANFHVASGSNSNLVRVPNVHTKSVQVAVNDVSKRELESIAETENGLGKRAKDVCTDRAKAAFIDNSYVTGKQLAALASTYASSGGPLLKSYFGTTKASVVTGVLNKVATDSNSTRTLNCVDALGACGPGIIAYTVIATTNIYFCSIFFNEQADPSALCSGTTVEDRDISGGTTLHEFTHALSGTKDYEYGCTQDQNFAISNPTSAANNADNYNCFATAVYAAQKCTK